MRVIFLDIDGVMISGISRDERLRKQLASVREGTCDWPRDHFDPTAIAFVNLLVEDAKARIVLHSDWRRHYTRQTLHDYMQSQGLRVETLHDDWWIEAPFAQRKQEAILGWLDVHPGVSAWCVLDDDPVFTPSKDIADAAIRRRLRDCRKRQVRVDTEGGISAVDCRRALQLLGVAEPVGGSPRPA